MEQFYHFDDKAYHHYYFPRIVFYLSVCFIFDIILLLYYSHTWATMEVFEETHAPVLHLVLLVAISTVLLKVPAIFNYKIKPKWKCEDTIFVKDHQIIYRVLTVKRKEYRKKFYVQHTFNEITALKQRRSGAILVCGKINSTLYDETGMPGKESFLYYDLDYHDRIRRRIVLPPYFERMDEIYSALNKSMQRSEN